MTTEVLVRFEEVSHWKSCAVIEEDYARAFKGATSWFQDSPDLLPGNLRLIDHRWIKAPAVLGEISQRKVWVYIYGDFTLRIPQFIELRKHLKRHEVHYVVASSAQARLVERIFPELSGELEITPYPVDLSSFRFSQEDRKMIRRQHGIDEGTEVFGHFGRLSPQKGTLALMKSFLRSGSNAHLLVSGPLHNHPFWQFDRNALDQSFEREFRPLLEVGRNRITWVGDLPRSKMPGYFSAVDQVLAPGTFHDEDFNLGLSEALAVGLPCVVTPWGGNYRQDPRVRYFDIELSDRGYQVTEESLDRFFRTGQALSNFSHQRPEVLSAIERNRILSTPEFLKNSEGSFDLGLYRGLYGAYLP